MHAHQLNDFTHPVTANMAVSNYGMATPHYTLAAQVKEV
jgi:hypothetical protein